MEEVPLRLVQKSMSNGSRPSTLVAPVSYLFFLLVCAKLLHLCPTLWDPMDCSPPGSSVHRILQARLLEWVAISFSRGSSQPRDQTHISCVFCTGERILYH